MYAIRKYDDIGFKIKAKENKLIFEDTNTGCYINYDLLEKKVYTNIVFSTRIKMLNNLETQMKKELGWI